MMFPHTLIKIKHINKSVRGIILSGGPLNVYQIKKYRFDKKIIELDLKTRKIKLSVKAAQIDEERELLKSSKAIEHYFGSQFS